MCNQTTNTQQKNTHEKKKKKSKNKKKKQTPETKENKKNGAIERGIFQIDNRNFNRQRDAKQTIRTMR